MGHWKDRAEYDGDNIVWRGNSMEDWYQEAKSEVYERYNDSDAVCMFDYTRDRCNMQYINFPAVVPGKGDMACPRPTAINPQAWCSTPLVPLTPTSPANPKYEYTHRQSTRY